MSALIIRKENYFIQWWQEDTGESREKSTKQILIIFLQMCWGLRPLKNESVESNHWVAIMID